MTDIFEEILKVTAEVAGVDKKSIPLNVGSIKRWNSIARFWESRPNEFGDVLYDAMMCAVTGQYPQVISNKDRLLMLVVKAITFEHSLIRRWWDLSKFRGALDRVSNYYATKGSVTSDVMKKFIRKSLEYEVFYRKALETWNTVGASGLEKRDVRGMRSLGAKQDCFKKGVQFFIPNTDMWTYDDWTNQSNIINALKTAYGIDYSKNTNDFDELMMLAWQKAGGGEYYCRSYYFRLFAIQNITDSMLKLFWPVDTEEEMVKCFEDVLASDYVRYFPTDAQIASSCIYSRLLKILDEKHPLITPDIKRKLFDVRLGLYDHL